MRNFLIIVTGPFGGGKTELIGHAQMLLKDYNIPYEPKIITDSQFLTDVIKWDHKKNDGRNHVHDEKARVGKHPYQPETEHLTFISISSLIQEEMYRRFFSALGQIPDSRKYIFAELGAGVNGSPRESRIARNDYSYESIANGLRDGQFSDLWVNRVAAVIHIRSDFTLRQELNEQRKQEGYRLGDDVLGIKSRPLPDSVMLFTKRDDFSHLHNYFRERMLGHIVEHIENSGTPDFFDKGRKIILERVNHNGLLEGRSGGKEAW